MRLGLLFRPRKWVRGITILLLCLTLTGTMMLLQGGAILYFWAKQSTNELEELIPLESSKKVKYHNHSLPQQRIQKQANTLESTLKCKAIFPGVLLVIRVPKCASTSFVNLLRDLSHMSSFDFLFNPSGAYDWDDRTIREVVKQIQSKKGRVVYARHFYYTNFKLYGLKDYTYITIIREPVARFISSYLYYHFSSKPQIQRMLKPAFRNESILDCVTRRHNGCAHNWLTKYFCGHQKFCSSGADDALAAAKENMLLKFAAVGLLEEMNISLEVFSKVLPNYFGYRELIIPGSNKNEQSMVLNPEEKEAVLMANLADLELYAYAQKLLYTIYQLCKN